MKYRPEIDGLRALAVVPVILFHAGFGLFGGGFVGVDVFFVISGYLITTILMEDLENDRFSIVDFYERRARRILPALFLVLTVCMALAWILMLPRQMMEFSKSVIAVIFFVSNVLFWRESGYFDTEAEEKPLLHTWSLAVEEQYYLLFPVFLFLAWRFGKRNVLGMIVAMAGVSLFLSEWGWRNAPTANFYLAPTRAWELFAGSIAAFVVQKRGVRANNILSGAGLGAILISVFFYDENLPFPSLYTLLPVGGVVLLVLFAGRDTVAARVLSTRILVGIGLISYSAYLWHQPLFAFARLRSIGAPGWPVMTALSLLTFVLAVLSWRYVERPFRNRTAIPRGRIFSFSAAAGACLAVAGMFGIHTDGARQLRFDPQVLAVFETARPNPLRSQCHWPQFEASLQKDACAYFGQEASVAVMGDSHAAELAYALADVLKPYGESIRQYSISGCRHDYQLAGNEGTVCYRWHQGVIDDLVSNDGIDEVILSYRNEYYLDDPAYRATLVKMAETLLDAGKEVVLVLQAPLAGAHIEKYLGRNLSDLGAAVSGLSVARWREIYSAKDSLLAELPEDVVVVDPVEFFCDDADCLVMADGVARYFDDNHMSVDGARILARALVLDADHELSLLRGVSP